jgi:multiple sugar transport system ATP-binding protein
MSSVTLQNVTKSYIGGHLKAVDRLSLEVRDGEFLVLVGPSGCGKSTALRMIAGLEEVTDGGIWIGDEFVNDTHPKDRDIAMVFQNYALYPHMSIAANMGFSLEHRGTPKAEINERVQWAAGILGLTEYLDRYPRQLSGGQRQRVAMGRAIVRNPKVFLFDEPLSNLDAKLRVVMRGEIKALHQRLKTTTVYVTHDQVEAMTMADKIVVLNAGNIEQIGAPLDLYDRPANQFVAGFIGSPAMNFISGKIENGTFKAAGIDLPLEGKLPDGAAVYGIRPEHFALSENGLTAEVLIVEPMGSETQVTMKLGEATVIGIFRERVIAEPGSTLNLALDTANVHLFDTQTGQRLN